MNAPLPPTVLRSVLIALMLAIFLGALDQTIVAVSMPAISTQFNNVSLLAWVISGYMVAMTVAVPIYGKLGDLYGRRRMILFGIGLFTLASVCCALSQSMEQLVVARVLQGIGAGGMISVSQAIIGDIIAPRDRGRYQGYFSSMYALASVTGPVFGGYLTEYLSWHWVFWLNLPLGLLAWWIARRTLRVLVIPQRAAVIDYLGSVLLVAGLGTLLMAITLIGQGYAWNSQEMLGLLSTAVVGLVLFVTHQRRTPEPLLPLKLFGNRTAVLCWCTIFMTSFQAISLSMLMPLRFQSITGAGADSAALYLMPLAIGLPIGAYTGGRLTARSGRFKPQILTGALCMPLAIIGMALTPPDAWLTSATFMLLTGIASGLQFPTSLVAAQSSVEPRDIGVATSTTNLFRALGGAIGVASMSALLLAMLGHTGPIQPGMSEPGLTSNILLDSLSTVDGPALQALRSALSLTFRDVLLGSALISLLGLAAALRLPNQQLRGRT